MKQSLKVFCGVVALALSVINFLDRKPIVGGYWLVVHLYWTANMVGA